MPRIFRLLRSFIYEEYMTACVQGSLDGLYRRASSDGAYTRIFDALGTTQRRFLVEVAPLRDDEFAVIGSVNPSSSWMLLTTQRLFWSAGGNRPKFRYRR